MADTTVCVVILKLWWIKKKFVFFFLYFLFFFVFSLRFFIACLCVRRLSSGGKHVLCLFSSALGEIGQSFARGCHTCCQTGRLVSCTCATRDNPGHVFVQVFWLPCSMPCVDHCPTTWHSIRIHPERMLVVLFLWMESWETFCIFCVCICLFVKCWSFYDYFIFFS